jgi:hypothetical protein
MTALAESQIKEYMERGSIKERLIVTPLIDTSESFDAASVNVRLGTEFIIMKKQYLFQFKPRTVLSFFVSAALILVSGRPVKSLFDFVLTFFFGMIFLYSVLDKAEVSLIRDVIKKR